MSFSGAYPNLGNIMKLSSAVTRSITAENVYGEKGRGGMADWSETPQPEVVKIGQPWDKNRHAGDLGQGWKIRPAIRATSEDRKIRSMRPRVLLSWSPPGRRLTYSPNSPRHA